MEFIRIDSIVGTRIQVVVEMSVEEYNRMVRERNRRAEVERQNEMDRQREHQWYPEENQP